MCRLLAYIGPPTLIADVVLWPDRCTLLTCAPVPAIMLRSMHARAVAAQLAGL